MTQSAAERQALARALLAETEPDELEFFGEYVKAVDHKVQSGRLGPEWGIPELASVGPAVSGIVTAKGKAEIMAIVGRLVVEAKLSPRDAQRLTKRVAGRFFCPLAALFGQ